MMLCKADFEEIFPELFDPNHRSLTDVPVGRTSPTCIARWEDDGGRTCDGLRLGNASTRPEEGVGYSVCDPMNTGIALATITIAAAYGAAWTMLASFGRIAKV